MGALPALWNVRMNNDSQQATGEYLAPRLPGRILSGGVEFEKNGAGKDFIGGSGFCMGQDAIISGLKVDKYHILQDSAR
jgi:hypothetical protein